MRKVASLVVTLSCGLGLVVACSSSDSHPSASGDVNGEGGTSSGSSGGDSGLDAGVDAEATRPASCHDTMKDNDETDIDCGGPTCAPCPLGKACTAATDCLDMGATCENNICALCKDGKADGTETDVDCGGVACGTCTIGKRCTAGSDCSSGSCVNSACACPTNMTIVSTSTKGAYCVDSVEVTKGQYNQFITANVSVATQTGSCLTDNLTFIPRNAWPPATVPFDAQTNPDPLGYSMGLPVHYVDWCDAVAYCKWAKKDLCGGPSGAAVAPTDGNDATKSSWYNACTAQGNKTYPYGLPPYQQSLCNGDGQGTPGKNPMGTINDRGFLFGYPINNDTGIYAVVTADDTGVITGVAHNNCQGGSVGLFQMSGNVAEWENSCDGTAATSNCQVRGGSYAATNGETDLACAAKRSVVRVPSTDLAGANLLADIGIRCCLY